MFKVSLLTKIFPVPKQMKMFIEFCPKKDSDFFFQYTLEDLSKILLKFKVIN